MSLPDRTWVLRSWDWVIPWQSCWENQNTSPSSVTSLYHFVFFKELVAHWLQWDPSIVSRMDKYFRYEITFSLHKVSSSISIYELSKYLILHFGSQTRNLTWIKYMMELCIISLLGTHNLLLPRQKWLQKDKNVKLCGITSFDPLGSPSIFLQPALSSGKQSYVEGRKRVSLGIIPQLSFCWVSIKWLPFSMESQNCCGPLLCTQISSLLGFGNCSLIFMGFGTAPSYPQDVATS